MANNFYPLTVTNISHITPDAVCISLKPNLDDAALFNFKAGQYLTLKVVINGQEIRRNYSLCNLPNTNLLQIGVKKLAGGLYSTWANEALTVGTVIESMPPIGKFTLEHIPEPAPQMVFFAGGSGITPILSLLQQVLTTTNTLCTLVFSNSYTKTIMFKEELEALKNKYIGRFQLVHLLSREAIDSPINTGRLDEAKTLDILKRLVPTTADTAYFICGPFGMTEAVKKALQSLNIADNQIHTELFNAAPITKKIAETNSNTSANQAMATVNYALDGRKGTISLAYDGDNILDALRAAGADAPYACKGGVCCTCKAKLLSGTVDMDVVYGLEPDEIAAGYILTCQAHPTSADVIISYDE